MSSSDLSMSWLVPEIPNSMLGPTPAGDRLEAGTAVKRVSALGALFWGVYGKPGATLIRALLTGVYISGPVCWKLPYHQNYDHNQGHSRNHSHNQHYHNEGGRAGWAEAPWSLIYRFGSTLQLCATRSAPREPNMA